MMRGSVARLRVTVFAGMIAMLVGAAVAVGADDRGSAAAAGPCPPGYHLVDLAEMAVERVMGASGEDGRQRSPDQMIDPKCLSDKHPESFAELGSLMEERASQVTAPFRHAPQGAFRAAVEQTRAMAQRSSDAPGSAGAWEPYGSGPLISNDERFDSVNGLGLAELNGRIDSFAYDEGNGRLFALIGTGGIWMSEDLGDSWISIGDNLPTQIFGALDWSPSGGRDGTVVAVGGEHLMGGNTYTGLGAYWTDDLGETWHHSEGVPDGLLGFQVEVDPTDPAVVYAATSQGLYRSTDTGKTFINVALPTSEECAGVTGYANPCEFANFVTDVVVKEPGGVGEAAVEAGTVVAAVGYRAGMAQFPDGTVHSPGNGIYRSATGEPGTFEKLDVSGSGGCGSGFAPQQNIGRTELGKAFGPDQDHDWLYAIVEDAELFNGGAPTIDIGDPGNDDQAIYNTTFNGIYVSDDFGASWTCMADTVEISENPLTNSGLVGVGQALLFAPGVQAWYDEYIAVDPTRQTEDGVPTRIHFGLEELWANRGTTQAQDGTPQDPRGDFHVIGPYFADETCYLLDTGTPTCPSGDDLDNPETTTHPDHHDGIFVPAADGGVHFIAGTDGGAYRQTVAEGGEFVEEGWAEGKNDGFNTLLPYHARMAKDGTVWYGLQDNGTAKTEPDGKKVMTFGGDGAFVAVDPDDSDYAWGETPFAGMRFTTDGGRTWTGCSPPISNSKFINPFVMDPTDPNHVMTAGRQVVATVDGPETCTGGVTDEVTTGWTQVFDLGTNEDTGAANSMSAIDVRGASAYVGFCGPCDLINNWDVGFANGIATNVGQEEAPEKGSSAGWHIAAAEGLPNRYITSVAVDPEDPATVYVTLGGYANREWVPPGSYLDPTENLGEGHVFRSTDAGETFTDLSGDLPNVHATWITLRDNGQMIVGTDAGVFLSADADGTSWVPLDDGLPASPVTSLQIAPHDPDLLVASTFGRGIYTYRFEDPTNAPAPERPAEPAPVPLPTTGGGLAWLGALATGAAVIARRWSRRRRWT